MALIQNDRDVLLQGAAVRTVPVTLPGDILLPGFTGIEIVPSPTGFFNVDASNNATPSQITLTAVLKQVSGIVNWSIVIGSATLTIPLGGSNLVRYLNGSDMGTDNVVIQVSVTDSRSGTTYTSQVQLSKIHAGAAGPRGTVTGIVNVTSAVWSNVAASDKVTALTGSSELKLGDVITEQYSDSYVETRTWDGTGWIVINQLINGNLLTRGSVIANAMAANSITAANAALANASIATAKIQVGAIDNARIGSVIQSDNYVPGSSGWTIRKDGSAEFNGVVISRPQVVASGDFVTNAASAHFFGPPWGDPFSGEVKWYIDTGYNDVYDVMTTTRPGYLAKAICIQSRATWSSDPGGAKFYDVPVEAIPWSSIDHYKVGPNMGQPGGRMLMQLRVPMPRNVWGSVTSIRIDVIRWSLMRVT